MKGHFFDSRRMKGQMDDYAVTGKRLNDKENLRKEAATFRTRERRFNFEFKSFRFVIDNGGTFAKIVEKTRNQIFKVSIDFGGVLWVINSLRKAKAQFSKGIFFTKYQASYALFLMQRYNNQYGSFLSLCKIQQSIVKSVVVFPAGKEGEGWLGIAGELHHLLFDSPKRQQWLDQRKPVWNRGVIRKMPGNEREGKCLTYAEAVALKHKENKEVGSNNGQTGYSIEVDRDWCKVVILTREKLWDSWKGIQNSLSKLYKEKFLLKPFQPDKAAFVCNDKDEAEMFGRKNTLFIEGPYTIKLQGWNQEDVSMNKKVSFTGGWIDIEDLPLQWWKRDIFEAIGDKCGGLLEID